MKKAKTRVFSTVLVGTMVLSSIFPGALLAEENNPAPAETKEVSERLAGENRYETAAQIALEGWEKADVAILASGLNENLVDALTAAPLAKSLDAPILLTRGDKVPDATLEALEQLQVQEVYTVTGALKKADLEKFFTDKELEITVTELGGKDRFETSGNIADQLENVENVVIAYAYKNADAVSVASAAAIENMPILLTKKNVLPDPQADYLATIKDQNPQSPIP